jgi:predicted kinase
LCYILNMREWMRALMRRRGKRGANDSESTGKIGQEIPANQPTPLQPMYPEDKRGRASGPSVESPVVNSSAVAKPVASEPAEAPPAPAPAEPAALDSGKLVVETQPESPSVRRGVTPLSSDMLRNILFDDITEQRYQGLVFSTLRSLLRARLIAKMPWNYVDATNLSAHERRQWIKMAKSFGYEAQAVFFDVPLEVCMERNSRRERTVSDEIMHKMAERLRPPSFKEGFSKITMVRVKGAPPLKMDGVVVEPPSS